MTADLHSHSTLQDFDPLKDPAFLALPKRRIRSKLEIFLTTAATGLVVFGFARAIQWIVYDRLLREDALRLVGSALPALSRTRASLAELKVFFQAEYALLVISDPHR